MNYEKKRQLECSLIRCKHFAFCSIHWGARCREMGGERIPRVRPNQPGMKREPEFVGRMRPYFMRAK